MVRRLLVSGYKNSELGIFKKDHPGIHIIKTAIERKLRELLDENVLEWVIVSGQVGVEHYVCEVVFQLQLDYPELKLAILPPFLNQEERWNEETKEYYNFILEQADFVKSITDRNYEGPWQFKAKNKFLLDNTDGLLLVYDDEKEGSPKFLKREADERMKDGYSFFVINAYDLQAIAENIQEEQRTDW